MDPDFPIAYSYDDVLLVPQYSEIESRTEVDLTTKLTPKLTLKIPLISANMSDVTGVEMAVTLGKLGGLGVLPRFNEIEDQIEMIKKVKESKVLVAASIGCKAGFLERAEALVKAGARVLVLDVAHGHMKQAVDATKFLKEKFGKDVDIISGNVATFEAADALFAAGADCVKVGIGPGSICLTRVVTGVGVPQLSAVIEAARAARKHGKTIIADGGVKNSGDATKALCAGASAVMMGNQFAGTDEAPGKLIQVGKEEYKIYNGSTSIEEKQNHLKNMINTGKNYLKHIEGVGAMVAAKGPIKEIVLQYEANIKSGLSYEGARNIKESWEKAKFVRVTTLGYRENGAHDVVTH